MELIADGVLILAATVAGLYCLVLSRRLHSLTQMESGLGKAITGMSAQVDEMKDALSKAKSSTEESAMALGQQLQAAEEVANRLEGLLTKATDLSPPAASQKAVSPSSEEAGSDDESKLSRTSRRNPEGDERALDRKRIDGLISSYLNEFEGEDEAAIARRLVTALTSTSPIEKERAI